MIHSRIAASRIVCNAPRSQPPFSLGGLTSQLRKDIWLLAEGRLVNVSVAEGHPSAVMDMSFANQARCVEHLARYGGELSAAVYTVPRAIDEQVASLKLGTMGIEVDQLSDKQWRYLRSWKCGT